MDGSWGAGSRVPSGHPGGGVISIFLTQSAKQICTTKLNTLGVGVWVGPVPFPRVLENPLPPGIIIFNIYFLEH